MRELALLFLKLGTTAFGGPAAHIAMMERDVVRRRQWLTREQFLDYLGATNLIPGPNSTELALHIGHARGGWHGLLVAGLCFIAPATVIVLVAAWGYVRYHSLPAVDGVLYFVKPVIIAIVAQALWMLARTAVKSGTRAALAAATMAGAFAGVHEVLLLCAAGAAMVMLHAGKRYAHAFAILTLAQAAAPVPFGLWPLFLVFFKTGALLFGSGYVLLAFLRADLVERLQWLTEQQLLDAIVVGQITPGPVFTTATFVGYLIGGFPGAAVATVAIFLPAFVFVALSGPLVPRLRASPVAGAVLDGVNVASVALMAVVTWQLGHAALVDTTTWVIVLGSLVVLTASEINSTWLIAAAAAVGLLSAFIR